VQKRKSTASEQRAFVQAAEQSYQEAVGYIGSLRPTRRVTHSFRTITEMLHQVAKLGAEGWAVREDVVSHTLYAMGGDVILDKPESMVEADLVIVREQAAKDYAESVRLHNARVERMEADRATFEATKQQWLKEQAQQKAVEEDKAFRQAMAARGVRLPAGVELTSEWL